MKQRRYIFGPSRAYVVDVRVFFRFFWVHAKMKRHVPQVIFATDEWFAPAANLLKVSPGSHDSMTESRRP